MIPDIYKPENLKLRQVLTENDTLSKDIKVTHIHLHAQKRLLWKLIDKIVIAFKKRRRMGSIYLTIGSSGEKRYPIIENKGEEYYAVEMEPFVMMEGDTIKTRFGTNSKRWTAIAAEYYGYAPTLREYSE